jgi:hypothetical protein
VGHVVVSLAGDGVLVETYDQAGVARDLPFNLIVAC